MKALIIIALAVVLLFGCSQQAGGAAGNSSSTAGNATVAYAPAGSVALPQAPTRSTRGVMMADYKPPVLPPPPHFDFSNVTTPDGTLIVYYFHSSGCSACRALQPDIDRLKGKYPGVLWLDYDIATQDGRYAYSAFAAQLNLTPKEELVPQALVNGTVITDRFHINDTLEGVILNFTGG